MTPQHPHGKQIQGIVPAVRTWLFGERDRTTVPRFLREFGRGRMLIVGRGDNPLSAVYAGVVADAAIVAAAFAQRRKTSRNAFAEWAGTGNESARRLLAASIDPSRRGETLSTADFVRLLERSGVWDPELKRVVAPVEAP